uniref:Secreted protein n=1 Tax=Heterorhabditis bacteriophora TaxID=37862 RepID=A0A1I7WUJ1_HETBA
MRIMQVFSIIFVLCTMFGCVLPFRGGHGRPLYGVIGDVHYGEGSIPLRGFDSVGPRGVPKGYGACIFHIYIYYYYLF